MKKILILACLALTQIQALKHEVQFENSEICISKATIEPKEKTELHRDTLPHIVIGIKGGTITRLESDGREVDIEFPTGEAVYRPVDSEDELHRSVNKSDYPIEIIIIQIKK